jgi:hypothetical protein
MYGFHMATQVITTTVYTDDLDGSKAEGTVHFGFDGAEYEIDLSKSNRREFEKAMALYVGHARKVRNSRSRRTRGRRSAAHDLNAVRQWARANGYDVADRGRVPSAVLEAYESAR